MTDIGSYPSVTAVCVTRNRRRWLPRAIQCFQSQTVLNKRLLIVADGEEVWDLVPRDPRILVVTLPDDRRPRTIGDKRNFACSLARTEVIAHWDDDDWSAPTRLEDQIERLEDTNTQVTGYRTMLFHNGEKWWRYEGIPIFALGTSLCYKRSWWEGHPFPSMQVSEDGTFVAMAGLQYGKPVEITGDLRVSGNLSCCAGDGMQVASVHGSNTSPRSLPAHGQPVSSNYVPLVDFAGVEGYTW